VKSEGVWESAKEKVGDAWQATKDFVTGGGGEKPKETHKAVIKDL